jgi:hypothetical protein
MAGYCVALFQNFMLLYKLIVSGEYKFGKHSIELAYSFLSYFLMDRIVY